MQLVQHIRESAMAQTLVMTAQRIDQLVIAWSTRFSRPGAWDMKYRIAVLTLMSFIAMC
jgi:hypothetical protein